MRKLVSEVIQHNLKFMLQHMTPQQIEYILPHS